MSLVDTLKAECDTFASEVAGTPFAGEVRTVRARLDEPIRVAIAGRVKAGKSTLLNALVGERLAATDAGECTRIPTWYRHGDTYKVMAIRRDGADMELSFSRDSGKLAIDLGFLTVDEIERIEVQWPIEALKHAIFVDTPGLASLDDRTSIRTRELLGIDGERTSEADVVFYCLRHLHKSDAEYLGAFMDHSVAGSSASNAIAILTRADEVGAARPDAMDSAARIAARYAADPRVAAMSGAVVAIAGLLAETGRTLTEAEAATIRDLATQADAELGEQLISADRFVAVAGPVPAEQRVQLLDRLGIYGIRIAVTEARRVAAGGGRVSATELGGHLVAQSGMAGLDRAAWALLDPQVDALKARSALQALRSIAHRVAEGDAALADHQLGRLEQLEAGATDLLAQRLRFLLTSGELQLGEEDRVRAMRLLHVDQVVDEATTPDDPDARASAAAAIAELVAHWRTVGGGGLLDPLTAEAVDGLARVAEALHHELTTAGS
jgi:hypothetical protein